MTTWLKQSTATDVELGPFIDDTDGKTAETALTLSQADCLLIKNGGASAQKNDATSATHLAGGHYKVPLNTTDTNTLGRLRLYVNESGALPVWRDFMVLPAMIYDSLVAGSDVLDASVTQWTGTAVATPTTAGVPEVDITHWNGTAVATPDTAGYPKVTIKDGTGTGELDTASGLVTLTSTSRAAIVDEVWDEALSGHVAAGSAGDALGDAAAAGSGDLVTIDGSATAVANLKADYDGTGYNKANSAIGTAAAVTGIVSANLLQIGGSQTSREKLAYIVNFATYGTVGAGSLTTTTCSTNLTEATNDHYNGLLLHFLTGALAGQSTLVTDYNGSTKVLTFAAVTDTPAQNDTFILV